MEIARHWRLKHKRYGLIGEVCPHCDAKIFHHEMSVPLANKKRAIRIHLVAVEKFYSYTTIYEVPSGFDENATLYCGL